MRTGVLLVVSGPSGVGKGTLIRGLMRRRPEVTRSVSCTTRPPRTGEVDGRDYHFVTPAQFSRMREAGELLEWATVHGDHSYGTPRAPVEAALASGQDIVLEIDYQGAISVRAQMGGRAVLVFVAPPTWGDLYRRLHRRDTESAQEVHKRLATARREIAHLGLFEYIVVNEDIRRATRELEAVLMAERQRSARLDWRTLQRELLQQAEVEMR